MLKYQWTHLTMKCHSDFEKLKNIVETVKPTIGAVDTETDGLHIINNKPFVVQFGFLDQQHNRGFTFAVDIEKFPTLSEKILSYWDKEALKLKKYMGHNIKFDLHMLNNIGHKYEGTNLTDTMFYIRFAHDALHQEEGGPPLGLKDYARKYIDNSAKVHEKQLKEERTAIARNYNGRFKQMIKEARLDFSVSKMQKLFKDCIFERSDLPKQVQTIYKQWLQDLPIYLQHQVHTLVESSMIRYNDLNRDNLLKYAHLDIVYTLEIYESLQHIIEARHQEKAIEIENKCILPWFELERTGFHADKEYLETSRIKLKEYILKQRTKFYEMAGEHISVGQHATIKRILENNFGLKVKSTSNEALNLVKNKLQNQKVIEFIDLLQELRTLEKWYSAYILRFQKELKFNDYLYATINQVGAVSGRVTSDFQQFPKKPIKDVEGNELFHPRKIVYTDSALIYLDYSQIELRFQALYTILLNDPDYNMCRAYMPYDCHNESGEQFDYNNPTLIKNYNHIKWFHNEDNSPWKPVDIHGATTTAATGLGPEDPEFSTLRSTIGKRVNFAKNYGAELARIKQMFPDKSEEECRRINDAYYKAFPGIKKYHEYCTERAKIYSNTVNLFGVRYYNVSGHKLKNLLIQGSAAYFLKLKIIELYEYTKKNNLKTKIQMQIHDELSWEYNKQDPPEIFFKFKEIMEDFKESKIPIIADMEVSTKTWADKKEISTLEELKGALNEVQIYSGY